MAIGSSAETLAGLVDAAVHGPPGSVLVCVANVLETCLGQGSVTYLIADG